MPRTGSLIALNDAEVIGYDIQTPLVNRVTGSLDGVTIEGVEFKDGKIISPEDVLEGVYMQEFINAGITGIAPVTTKNGDGTANFAACYASLYDNSDYGGIPLNYLVPAVSNVTFTDNAINYVYITYNTGSPIYGVTLSKTVVNSSDVVPVSTVFRDGNDLHMLSWDALGTGVIGKMLEANSRLNRFTRENGLGISVNVSRNILIEAGSIFKAEVVPTDLDAANTATDLFYIYEHSGTAWVKNPETTYDNTQYQGPTGFVTSGANKWTVNWVFRGMESEPHTFAVLGTAEYNTQALAESASMPLDLPGVISSHTMVVGRIVVQHGSVAPADGVSSPFDTEFSVTPVTNHDNLLHLDWDESGHTGLTAVHVEGVTDTYNRFISGNVDGVIDEIGELKYTNGFNRRFPETLGDISWDDGTRTFSIAVQGGETEYSYWVAGKKITQTTTKSVVIPDTTGTYYIAFDDATGTLAAFPLASFTLDLIYTYALVGLVYWNSIQSTGLAGDERHGIDMSSTDHAKEHLTFGARYEIGLDIEGLVDGDPNYTQSTAGYFWDEDIRHTVPTQTAHPFIYRLGADGAWTGTTPDTKIAHTLGGSYHVWNDPNAGGAGIWGLTEGTSTTDYWITFLIATPHIGGYQVKKVMGQNAYPSRNSARDAVEDEINSLKLQGLSSPEIVFLHAWIARRNGDLEDLADGSTHVDLRIIKGGAGAASATATQASAIATDTANFDGVLSVADTDLQLALNTMDESQRPGGAYRLQFGNAAGDGVTDIAGLYTDVNSRLYSVGGNYQSIEVETTGDYASFKINTPLGAWNLRAGVGIYEVYTPTGNKAWRLWDGAPNSSFVTDSVGRCGMGIYNPDSRLEILAPTTNTADLLKLGSVDDGDLVTFDSSGYLGIGTNNPSYPIDLVLTGATAAKLRLYNSNATAQTSLLSLQNSVANWEMRNLSTGKFSIHDGLNTVVYMEKGAPAFSLWLKATGEKIMRGVASQTANMLTLEDDTGTDLLTVDADGSLSAYGGKFEMRTNGTFFSSSLADATSKFHRLYMGHYDNAEEDILMLNGYAINGINYLYVGGGASSYNAANQIRFYTSSNSTTTVGTEAMRIDASQKTIFKSGVAQLEGLTTTERDALTAANGDIIYNSTTSKHQGYNGTWNDLY